MLKIIGITGTNGKSTSSFMVKHILESLGNKVGINGTLGLFEGDKEVPKYINGLKKSNKYFESRGCSYVVFEAYSRPLAKGMWDGNHFEVGAFTNLSQEHMDLHHTMKKYAEAKARLFPMCEHTVANLDDPWMEFVTKGANGSVYTYSLKDPTANLYAKDIVLSKDGSTFTVVESGIAYEAHINLLGLFNIYNVLTAIACCLMVGVPISVSIEAIQSFNGIKGRLEKVPVGSDYDVYIDYAHTPDGLEQVLKTLREFADHRLVVLFGCGGNRDRSKRPKMAKVA